MKHATKAERAMPAVLPAREPGRRNPVHEFIVRRMLAQGMPVRA